MPNIEIGNGKTLYVSVYEYYFLLKDEDMDEFFQSCLAEDVGNFVENPFSNSINRGRLEVDEDEEIENIPDCPETDI